MATPGTYSVSGLLDPNYFIIPDFQRGYDWEPQQLVHLLRDLNKVGDRQKEHFFGTVVLLKLDEFSRGVGVNLQHVQVVDGQQRLTTILLLFRACQVRVTKLIEDVENLKAQPEPLGQLLRDNPELLLAATNQELYDTLTRPGTSDNTARQKLENWIQQMHREASNLDRLLWLPDGRFRIQLNFDSQDYLMHILQDPSALIGAPTSQEPQPEPVLRPHQRLRSALQQLLYHVKDLPYMSVSNLILNTNTNLRVNVYFPGNRQEVGVLFDSLNMRGKPLNTSEALKNALFVFIADNGLPEELLQAVIDCWTFLLKTLYAVGLGNTSDEDEILRFSWYVFTQGEPKSWTRNPLTTDACARVVDAILTTLRTNPSNKLGQNLKSYLSCILRGTLMYCLFKGSRSIEKFGLLAEDAPPPTRSLGKWVLKLAGTVPGGVNQLPDSYIEEIMPMLMALCPEKLRRPQDFDSIAHVDWTLVVDLLPLLETYIIRAIILTDEMTRNQRNSTLRKLSYKHFRNVLAAAASNNNRDELEAYKTTKHKIQDLIPQDNNRSPFANLFQKEFWESEYVYFLREYERLLLGRESREDIDSTWYLWTLEHIAPTLRRGKRRKQEPQTWKERLGNLLALPQRVNSELGDKRFPHKKQIYERQDVRMCQLVSRVDANVWDEDAAIQHQDDIISKLETVWGWRYNNKKRKGRDEPDESDDDATEEEEEVPVAAAPPAPKRRAPLAPADAFRRDAKKLLLPPTENMRNKIREAKRTLAQLFKETGLRTQFETEFLDPDALSQEDFTQKFEEWLNSLTDDDFKQ